MKLEVNVKEITTTTPIVLNSSSTTLRTRNANKETSMCKVHCFKCLALRHYQNACPNKRVVMLREVVAIRDKLFEEEVVLEDTFVVEEVCKEQQEEEKYEAPKFDTSFVLRAI